MKRFFLLFLLVLPMSVFAQLIYTTEWKSEADAKVFITEWKSEADLIVYKTNWKSEAKDGNNGLWYFSEWKSESKKVFFTEWKSEADIKIYYTNWKSEAGWKNDKNKKLLD